MIYFIQCGNNGPIKIGQTDNDVEQRMVQLQIGCPYELRLLWVYIGEDYTESQIHVELSHERIRGEWFRPSRTLLYFIQHELCNEYSIATKNGRCVSLTERFSGLDNVSIRTSHPKTHGGGQRWCEIHQDFKRKTMTISPGCVTDLFLK